METRTELWIPFRMLKNDFGQPTPFNPNKIKQTSNWLENKEDINTNYL